MAKSNRLSRKLRAALLRAEAERLDPTGEDGGNLGQTNAVRDSKPSDVAFGHILAQLERPPADPFALLTGRPDPTLFLPNPK